MQANSGRGEEGVYRKASYLFWRWRNGRQNAEERKKKKSLWGVRGGGRGGEIQKWCTQSKTGGRWELCTLVFIWPAEWSLIITKATSPSTYSKDANEMKWRYGKSPSKEVVSDRSGDELISTNHRRCVEEYFCFQSIWHFFERNLYFEISIWDYFFNIIN